MNNPMTIAELCAKSPDKKIAFKMGKYFYILTDSEAIYRKVKGEKGELRSIMKTIKLFPNGFCIQTTFAYRIGDEIEEKTAGEFLMEIEKHYQSLKAISPLDTDQKAALESIANLIGLE